MKTVPNTLTNERVVVFVDYHNTRHALRRQGQRLDLVALRDYLGEGRHLIETLLYIATHPRAERQEADPLARAGGTLFHRLQRQGFLVRTKTGQVLPDGRLKCDLDLEMALDVVEFVRRAHPDIVVLVTGDGDFTPLARRLRLQGVRVEVASTPRSASAALQAMANGFVDLRRFGLAEDDPLVDPIPAYPVETAPEPPRTLDEAPLVP